MKDKERIRQIAVQTAKKMRKASYPAPYISDAAAIDLAHALAESPEFIQAMLPDGVEDAKVWCLGYNGQKLGLIMSDPSFYKPELEAIVQNNVYDLVVLDLYPASAILAATAPLKAEIERLKKASSILIEGKEIAEKTLDHLSDSFTKHTREIKNLDDQLTAEQTNAKVLADALENCRLFSARYRQNVWAETILRFCSEAGAIGSPMREALANVRESK